MTSTIRVSEIKNGSASAYKNSDGKPKSGTKLRRVYDALRRGEIVKLGGYSTQLRDMYGMEIERVGKTGTRLLGEWDGPYYVPIERIVSEETETV
jgi:hypothetical protein